MRHALNSCRVGLHCLLLYLQVTDGVYVSQGYSYVNIVFIDGPDGVIVIDTGESLETAEKTLAAWRQSNDKPIKAIILTHHHTDHICGLDVGLIVF